MKRLYTLIIIICLILSLTSCNFELQNYKNEKIKYINSHKDNYKTLYYFEDTYNEIVNYYIEEIKNTKSIDEVDIIIKNFEGRSHWYVLDEKNDNFIRSKYKDIENLDYNHYFGTYDNRAFIVRTTATDSTTDIDIFNYNFRFAVETYIFIIYEDELYILDEYTDKLHINELIDNKIITERIISKFYDYYKVEYYNRVYIND